MRASLLGAGPGFEDHLPPALAGLEVREVELDWPPTPFAAAVVHDGRAGSVSMVVPVQGVGFPVASLREQDGLLAGWGAALAPLARARCPVSRVTWQEWTHPAGVAGHREFLAALDRPHPSPAGADYDELLDVQAPVTIAHEVLLTVTVDRRRVRRPRRSAPLAAAIDALGEETRLLVARLESAGLQVGRPLSPLELSTAIRLRCDPSRARQLDGLSRSLAAAVGRGTLEWGPMAVEADWFHARVDGAHPPVVSGGGLADAAGGRRLAGSAAHLRRATRTVTVVLEPVPLARAAADANRQLTSIESDHAQKERHGFRLTARERRRQADVEGRDASWPRAIPSSATSASSPSPPTTSTRSTTPPAGWSRPPPSRCSTCAPSPPARPKGGWRRFPSADPSDPGTGHDPGPPRPAAAPLGRGPPTPPPGHQPRRPAAAWRG